MDARKVQQNKKLAERVGFEPTLEFPLNTLSKRAPSATRPSLRLSKAPSLRSGFRQRAQTPAYRLNFSHSAISPAQVGTGVIIQADGDEDGASQSFQVE